MAVSSRYTKKSDTMVVLNLTEREAEFLFWLMVAEERAGRREATSILSKLPLPKRKWDVRKLGLIEIEGDDMND